MTAERRVTSIDVASAAGVSQATVARTFSSPGLVSDETKARVIAVADRLGYVPDAIARSLKQQRTNIIGAVVPAHGEYWQHVLTAFSRQLAQRSKQLLLFSFEAGGNVDEVLATVRQFRLDGLILASANITQSQLAQMWESGLPIVAFNQPAASGVAPSVSVDNEGGMRDLARHVVEAGCEDVVFIGGDRSASTDRQRYLGAAQALGDAGVPCAYVEAGAFTYEAGYKAAQLVAERPALPDAVMVAGDELAFGVVDGLSATGVEVPDDVVVTGFDGLPQASWARYDLTTLVQPVDTLVDRSIDLLLAARPDDAEPADVVIAGTVRLGASTAASTQREDPRG